MKRAESKGSVICLEQYKKNIERIEQNFKIGPNRMRNKWNIMEPNYSLEPSPPESSPTDPHNKNIQSGNSHALLF